MAKGRKVLLTICLMGLVVIGVIVALVFLTKDTEDGSFQFYSMAIDVGGGKYDVYYVGDEYEGEILKEDYMKVNTQSSLDDNLNATKANSFFLKFKNGKEWAGFYESVKDNQLHSPTVFGGVIPVCFSGTGIEFEYNGVIYVLTKID